MVEVENLVKRYGDHLAVDHISFQVSPGKIYGFLGPNGAGKSTTMNIMTGYIKATEGSVKINGYDIVKEAEEARKCIGYLPEIPPLYQDMTVEEYLSFAAELKKIPKRERKCRIGEALEMTMLTEMSGRLIRNLSKGYKQRTGLAQAVLGYPEVIILDEPTVGLDPKQIIEIRDLIRKLGEKHTVILSSHILSEVQAVCDEIMILSRGKLVANDTPEGLSRLMGGGARLELHIAGSGEKVEEMIKSFDRVQKYYIEDSGEKLSGKQRPDSGQGGVQGAGGCVKLTVETDAKEDIREELFYALARERMPIMSMQRIEKSLEDVFLELTEGEEEEAGEGSTGKGDEKIGENVDKSVSGAVSDRKDEGIGVNAGEEKEGGQSDGGNL